MKDISLKLFNGENLVVLGKSGSGKSVLIKCIVGLIKADNCTIQVFHHNVTALSIKELGEVRQEFINMNIQKSLEIYRSIENKELMNALDEKLIEISL